MARAAEVTVRVENLPKFARLYHAAHAVLVERLLPPHEILPETWNELLAAHDDIAGDDE